MLQDEDTRLLRAAREGDGRARERIVAEHLHVVRSVAARYRDLGLSFDDLLQEGAIGLLDAIERYDEERGPDFETYARFRVRRAIRNALTDQARLIRLPKQVVERRRAIERADARLRAVAGQPPSTDELAEATGLSPAAVLEARNAASNPVSLDEPVLADGAVLETVVADPAAADPELEAVERERIDLIEAAIAELPARQRELLARHFGLGRESETIGDVAASLHVSQQRARTIEREALYALREWLEPRDQSQSVSFKSR